MKKIVVINDKFKTITYQNKKFRTPATISVSERELSNIKICLRMAGVKDYYITDATQLQERPVDTIALRPDVKVVAEPKVEKAETTKPKAVVEEIDIITDAPDKHISVLDQLMKASE